MTLFPVLKGTLVVRDILAKYLNYYLQTSIIKNIQKAKLWVSQQLLPQNIFVKGAVQWVSCF